MGVRTRSLNPFFKLLFCVFANVTEGKYSAFLWLCFLLLKWSICFSVNCLLCVSCWFYLNAYDVTLSSSTLNHLVTWPQYSGLGKDFHSSSSGQWAAPCMRISQATQGKSQVLGPCADAVAWWVLAKQWSAELVKH